MKKIWMGYMVAMHVVIQITAFLAVGVIVGEWLDSTIIGLIAAIIAYATRLLMILVVPLAFVFVGLPNLLFAKLGWITEADLG